MPTPAPRRARKAPGRKTRQPKIKADEKAAIDKNAREIAKEVNKRLAEIEKRATSKNYSPADRRRANDRRRKQRQRALKREGQEQPICKGFRWDGKPCQLPPLIPANWDGPNEPTGLYCIHHDPNITRDETESYILHGSANRPVPRRVTPGELAHVLVQRNPQLILEPYLKALGMRFNEDGELEKTGTGLKLYGYSRGGEVVKSGYADLIGQVNVAEKLMDRVYGKPRQAVDLASQNTTVSVNVEMTVDRVDQVTQVLSQSGAFQLPNGNGNGNGSDPHELVESTATDLLDT